MTPASILFVGQTVAGSRTKQRIKALENLGCRVEVIATSLPGASYEDKPSLMTRLRYRLRYPADAAGANGKILNRLNENQFDVLWLERAVEIGANTLRRAKQLNSIIKIVWYAEDDMMNPRHRTRQVEAAMPYYDLWVTTKSFNAELNEVPTFGVKNILFVNNSYDPSLHRPINPSEQDRTDFGSEVSFVGTHEKDRADSLIYLAQQGVPVRVWGNGWTAYKDQVPGLLIEGRPAYDDEYVKVICCSEINLCFLRKENRDLQTCRSIEIPACGGFMLHERNAEMSAIFKEDSEAAYFTSDQDLLEQCKKWLMDSTARGEVAKNGLGKVTKGTFSHDDRLREILDATSQVGN
ncbi:MAG: glycosyltransferase [Rhodospirillaceae bacterium]|jgi:spore maturation protein CgeB|nr:glycosyltransferase [Rhodospirillaceae bacterium]